MLVRGIITAAVGSVLHHYSESKKTSTTGDKKGKAAAVAAVASASASAPTMNSTQRNYGSAGRLERPASFAASRSGERLDSVPEQMDDSEGESSPWNDMQEAGSESCNEDEDDEYESVRCKYLTVLSLRDVT